MPGNMQDGRCDGVAMSLAEDSVGWFSCLGVDLCHEDDFECRHVVMNSPRLSE